MKNCAICEKPLKVNEVVFCKSCEVFYEYEIEHNRRRDGLEKLRKNALKKDRGEHK